MQAADFQAFLDTKSKATKNKKQLVTKDKREIAKPQRSFATSNDVGNAAPGTHRHPTSSPRRRANPLNRVINVSEKCTKKQTEREQELHTRYQTVLASSTVRTYARGDDDTEEDQRARRTTRPRREVVPAAQLREEKRKTDEKHKKWQRDLDSLEDLLSPANSFVDDVLLDDQLDASSRALMMRKKREEERKQIEQLARKKAAKEANTRKARQERLIERLANEGEKKGEKLEAMTKKHMDQFGKPAIDAHSRRMAKDRKGFQGVIDWDTQRNDNLERKRSAQRKADKMEIGTLAGLRDVKEERLKANVGRTKTTRREWSPPNSAYTVKKASPRPSSSPRPLGKGPAPLREGLAVPGEAFPAYDNSCYAPDGKSSPAGQMKFLRAPKVLAGQRVA